VHHHHSSIITLSASFKSKSKRANIIAALLTDLDDEVEKKEKIGGRRCC
jgi:hypothetical protein